MNLKNERIKKLYLKGLTDPIKIARHLGLPSPQRVVEGLIWLAARGEITWNATTPSDPSVED